MLRRTASETARPKVRRCAFALASAILALGAAAQVPVVGGELHPEVQRRLAALTGDKDPVLRGEAALLLGTLHCSDDETAIRAVASDRAEPAQIRGLIGLARLGPAGAEVELGRLLEELDPEDPRRFAAAYGLGLLPDDHPTPQIDAYIERNSGGNYRQERDTIAALLGGLASSPHASRRRSCQNLLADASMRDDGVRALAVVILQRSGGQLPDHDFEAASRTEGSLERWALLDVARARNVPLGASELQRVRRMASRDHDPRVRAAALRLLLSAARPEVVELAERSVESSHPEEAAVALEVLLTLGGTERRERLANRITSIHDPALLAAMLDAWHGMAPDRLVEDAAKTTSDTRQPPEVRMAAARLLVRVEDSRAPAAVRALAEATTDAAVLAEAYRALLSIGHGDEVIAGVEAAAKDPDARPLLAARIGALVRARHPAAPDLLEAVLAEKDLDTATLTEVVTAWRRAVEPPIGPIEQASLPQSLVDILR